MYPLTHCSKYLFKWKKCHYIKNEHSCQLSFWKLMCNYCPASKLALELISEVSDFFQNSKGDTVHVLSIQLDFLKITKTKVTTQVQMKTLTGTGR